MGRHIPIGRRARGTGRPAQRRATMGKGSACPARFVDVGILVVLFVTAGLCSTPAFAQVDFSGEWAQRYFEDQQERLPGGELGDYTGVPLNDAARLRADTWDAAIYGLSEW